jgi:crotonobetainyl-CoA:carnitine CoA-transferase CaiB-like acyl-CoA transferase
MRHQYLVPYGPFLAGDGAYVNLVVASDDDWRRFCDAIGRAEWRDDPRFATSEARKTHRELLEGLIEELLASEPAGRWLERLAGAGLAHGRVRSVADAMEHPQLRARGMVVEGDSPVGALPLRRFPLAPDAGRPRVPGLGEDTDDVLRELGYDEAAIERLRAERVVG